ncbi:MAG: cytochrome c biogenesis protein CcsA [Acidobacteriaceae bacterium]
MSLLWLRVAAVLYAVAGATAFPAVLYGRPRWLRVSLPAAVAGFFFHLVAVVELMVAAHHLVPLGWLEVQATLALLIVVAYLLVYAVYRTAAFGIIALPLALVVMLAPAMGANSAGFVTPEMRSGWLVVHISALLAAYTALLFSLIASVLYLAQERRLKSKEGIGFLAWLPPLETMDRIAYLSLLIGFPCMTLGLLAGCLIAQLSVGPAYFLDPKVLLSFGMWALYVLMLVVRRSAGLRGRRAIYLSSVVFLVVLSVWAANTFSSVHRFPAP